MTTTQQAGTAATMLVCLPAGSSIHGPDRLAKLLADRLAPVAATGRAAPCPHHLPVPDPLLRLLYAPRPHRPGVRPATAAPVGLLDHRGHRRAIAAAAAVIHAGWRHAVAGTGPARPWRHFLDTHLEDPDRHLLEQAWEAFCAQARIAAMHAAERGGTTWFVADQYGPGVSVHQAGQRRLTGYITDTIQLGDAVLDPHGRLLAAPTRHDPASSTPSPNGTPTTRPPGTCWRGSTRTPSSQPSTSTSEHTPAAAAARPHRPAGTTRRPPQRTRGAAAAASDLTPAHQRRASRPRKVHPHVVR